MTEDWRWMRSVIPVDTETEFDVRPSGSLRMTVGLIPCRIGFGGVLVQQVDAGPLADTEPPEEASWIEACAELTDSQGQIFRCCRPVSAYSLFLTAAFGRPSPPLPSGSSPQHIDRLQGVFSRRGEEMVLCSHADESCRPFGYRLKQSYATLSLAIDYRAGEADELVIGMREMRNRGHNENPTPASVFRTRSAAALVLLPGAIDPFEWSGRRVRSTFQLTGRSGPPQPLVRRV